MRGKVRFTFITLALLCAVMSIATADTVTQDITYQGLLTDSGGTPLTGTYAITFNLYDVDYGGSPLATSVQHVLCTNGQFTTPVTFDPSLFDGRALWLGIAVERDPEMNPRQEIRPVPYAMSLRPGAVISDSTPGWLMMALNRGTGPALMGQSWDGEGIFGRGKSGGYFTTNGDGTATDPRVGVNVSTVYSHNPGIQVQTSGTDSAGITVTTSQINSRGITVNTQADNSAGIYSTATGPISPAIVGLSLNNVGVGGSGKWGGYFMTNSAGTEGDHRIGVNVSTPYDYNHGITVFTSGYNSQGVRTSTSGQNSAGVVSITSGIESVGFSSSSSGYNSDGLVTITTGNYSDGVQSKTWGDNSKGVSVETTGVNSEGVSVSTIGSSSDGIIVNTNGEASEGVTISTMGAWAPGMTSSTSGYDSIGINVYTYNETSDGMSVLTYGEVSNGVSAFTQGNHSCGINLDTSGQYSEGVRVRTAGFSSSGLYADVYGDASYGVYAASDKSSGIYAYTGRPDHKWGVYSSDYIGSSEGFLTQPADIAEYMPVREEVTPGTVLVIAKDGMLQPCTMEYDTRVAGIVSTAAGFTLGMNESGNPGEVQVALSGRVPCKVDASSGAIHPGDLLTSSENPGYAMKATDPKIGTILGKAIGTLESGTGTIEVLVTLQ